MARSFFWPGCGRRRHPRGQSAVELALVLPLLILLLIAVCDFARVFYASIGVADAARAGVQYGAQNRTTAVDYAGIKQAALNDASGVSGVAVTVRGDPSSPGSGTPLCTCGGTVVACSPAQCANPENFVQVTVTASFHTLLTYPGIPQPAPLSSTAVMEVP